MKNNDLSPSIKCSVVCFLAAVFALPPAAAECESLRPYIGTGVQMLNLNVDKAYGGPLFKKSVPGATVFAGVRAGRFVGVEFGYNYFSRKQERLLNSGDIYPGTGETLFQISGGQIVRANNRTRTSIQDFNLGLTGYMPLENVACALSKTEIFATLGVSRTSVKLSFQPIQVLFRNGNIDNTGGANLVFRKKKIIPIARVGLQQNVTQNINVSIFSEWKRLNAFKMALASGTEVHLKNSVSYGLRVGYTF